MSCFKKAMVIFWACFITLNIVSVCNAKDSKETSSAELNYGKIDLIKSNNKIIINDILFTINETTRFFSSDGHSTSLRSFCKGDEVLYHASGELLLNELQLKEKGTLGNDRQAGQSASPRDHENANQIQFVNGVWKN